MGKLSRGILGGFSGKVGPVVGSSWKGLDVMKSKPLSVANPRTPAQTAQRNAFGGVVSLASLLLVSIIKPLWDRFAQQESGYNAFIGTNIKSFDSNGIISTPEDVVISKGKLAKETVAIADAQAPGNELEVEWLNTGGFDTDQAYIVLFNETQNVWEGFANAALREDTGIVLNPSTPLAASDNIRVYLAFKKADGTEVSDTSTITGIVS